jgi:hypothetical protein
MATEAAWLNRNRLTERRKRKCALTSTGLLMEGLGLEGRSSRRSLLQVHPAEKVGEARVGAQGIEHLIPAHSDHDSDGLNGSGDNPLATSIDLHPNALVNPAHLA